MDRRHMLLAAAAAALGTPVGPEPVRAAQAPRTTVPIYTGAMGVLWRSVQAVQADLDRLLADQHRDDEDWRVDVLAPFATAEVLRDAARRIDPPAKHAAAHDRWLEALDTLVAAGITLREGMLGESERTFTIGMRTRDRATELLAEVEALLPRRVRLSV